MYEFFKKRVYRVSAVTTSKHRSQEIDRETAIQTSQNEETNRIPFTLTYHPQNLDLHWPNREKIAGPLSWTPTRCRKKTTQMCPNHLRAILIFLIAPTTICGLSLHHGNTEPQKCRTKIHLSTGYTQSSRDQWTPLIRLIYSQIHDTIISPMAKLLHTPHKPTTPHNSSIRSDQRLTLEISAF